MQLALAGALRLEKRRHEMAHQKGDREERDTVLGVRSRQKTLTEGQGLGPGRAQRGQGHSGDTGGERRAKGP